MENGDAKVEQKVEHFLISKLQLVVSLGVFLSVVIGFFFKIQMDIALIKQNEFAHMERMQGDIQRIDTDYQKKDAELKQTMVDLMKIIGDNNRKLDTLIGQHSK